MIYILLSVSSVVFAYTLGTLDLALVITRNDTLIHHPLSFSTSFDRQCLLFQPTPCIIPLHPFQTKYCYRNSLHSSSLLMVSSHSIYSASGNILTAHCRRVANNAMWMSLQPFVG